MLTKAHVRWRTVASLPFDPKTMDIIVHREMRRGVGEVVRCNITQEIVHHSPTGFEVGYGGSGPADLALNVMALFLPIGNDHKRVVRCHYGKVSAVAWLLHQPFKVAYIATMPRSGGTIRGEEIRRWIDQNLPAAKRAALADVSSIDDDFNGEGDA